MKLWNIKGSASEQELDEKLRSIVISEMRAESQLLELLEFYTFTGRSDNIEPDSGTKIGNHRALNASLPTGATTALADPLNVALKIMSDVIKTDRALIDRKVNVESEHLRSVRAGARSLARYLVDQIINGDGSGESITGLVQKISGAQSITFDTADGGALPFGDTNAEKAQQAKFLEKLNIIVDDLNPDALVLPSELKARMETIARPWIRVSKVNDAVGKEQELTSYRNVQLVDAGKKKDDATKIITLNETCGASKDCTSLYALKFGEREDVTVATTETGLKVFHNPLAGNFVQTELEMQYNLAVVKKQKAVRLRGIRLG